MIPCMMKLVWLIFLWEHLIQSCSISMHNILKYRDNVYFDSCKFGTPIFWILPKLYKFCQSCGGNPFSEEKKLVLHWRKILYFYFTYISPLVLLLISYFHIDNLILARWFLLTLKHQTLVQIRHYRLIHKIQVAIATINNPLTTTVLKGFQKLAGMEKVS